MNCKFCEAEFEHKEHQRCSKCHKDIALPLGVFAFTNSTVCKECKDKSPFKHIDILYQMAKEKIDW